ncbi:MAG: ABC transporter permease [bacterium]|nr:ABC transporter permease [bacterium]
MRLFYLIKKEFIEIFRQKELLPLIIIAPLVQIIVLGYVVKTDIENIPVEIVNLSQEKSAGKIVNRICNTSLFNVTNISYRDIDIEETLKKGQVKAVILFRDPVTWGKSQLHYPDIQVLMDGIDSNTSAIAAGYFNGIIKKYILDDIGKQGQGLPIDTKTLIRFNPELKSINYMGPGIVALLLTILTLFLTSVAIVREKEQLTMDTLLISQLRPLEIYIGKAMPMAVIGLVQMSMGIGVVMAWFKVPVRGNLLYMLLSAVIFLAAILSYALLISTLASTQQQALFFSWFSMVTFILLSGLFTPVENIHPGVRFLADINPLRYLIKIIREIFLKGNGIEYFAKDLLTLGIIAVTIITVSTLNFKRLISK